MNPEDRPALSHFEVCRFIRDICLKLGLLPKVTASALLIYQTVYKCPKMATFDEIDPYTVAAGCVWLANKGKQLLLLQSICPKIVEKNEPLFWALKDGRYILVILREKLDGRQILARKTRRATKNIAVFI